MNHPTLPDGFLTLYFDVMVGMTVVCVSFPFGYMLINMFTEIFSVFKKKSVQDTDPRAINSTLKDIRKQAVDLTGTLEELSQKLQHLEYVGNRVSWKSQDKKTRTLYEELGQTFSKLFKDESQDGIASSSDIRKAITIYLRLLTCKHKKSLIDFKKAINFLLRGEII